MNRGQPDQGGECAGVRQEVLAFTVHVTVSLTALKHAQAPDDCRSPEMVVADEIVSNLESVPYVESVTVRNDTVPKGAK